MAWAFAERIERREEPSYEVVDHRERRVEAGHARLLWFDADRLGRSRLPEHRWRERAVAVGDRSEQRCGAMEAPARQRQPPHDEAEHVVAVASDRWQPGVGDDR